MNQATVDRRGFVSACTTACAGLLLGCVSMVTHPVPVAGNRIRVALGAYPELAKPDGAIKVLPNGWQEPIYILASGGDAYTAVSPICTHRGCTVDVSGARLVCPCHGSTFDRAGRVLKGPAERALTQYRVSRDGDHLVVELGGAS